MNIDIKDILSYIDHNISQYYQITGPTAGPVSGYSALNQYREGTITWIRDLDTYVRLLNTQETPIKFAIVGLNVHDEYHIIDTCVRCEYPKELFFSIMRDLLVPSNSPVSLISEDAYIGPDVHIGSNTTIGHHVSIVGPVTIGDNCHIKSGCTIGHSDFDLEGIIYPDGSRQLIEQYGGVTIGDNVWIGPNTVINRGTLSDTIIDDNVIIDGLCYISHNVHIYKDSILIAGTTVFGSASIGPNSYISASTIKNQTSIGANSTIGMGSVVLHDMPADITAYGSPATVRNLVGRQDEDDRL